MKKHPKKKKVITITGRWEGIPVGPLRGCGGPRPGGPAPSGGTPPTGGPPNGGGSSNA